MGTGETGNLYKGMTTFMIIGRTKNVTYVVHAVPEIEVEAGWLMGELIKCIKCLHLKRLNVKAYVCNNHPTNVSANRKLFALYEKDEDGIQFYIDYKPKYLSFDAVHFIKNIRNRLLHQKS